MTAAAFSAGAALFAAGVGASSFFFTLTSFFLNRGESIVDQAVSVIFVIESDKIVLHNLSDFPISDVRFFYGSELLSIDGANFAAAASSVRATIPEGAEALNAISANYIGIRGLRWTVHFDGRIEFASNSPFRDEVIRWMTWPWYHNKLRVN